MLAHHWLLDCSTAPLPHCSAAALLHCLPTPAQPLSRPACRWATMGSAWGALRPAPASCPARPWMHTAGASSRESSSASRCAGESRGAGRASRGAGRRGCGEQQPGRRQRRQLPLICWPPHSCAGPQQSIFPLTCAVCSTSTRRSQGARVINTWRKVLSSSQHALSAPLPPAGPKAPGSSAPRL